MPLTDASRIVVSDDSLKSLAEILGEEINLLTGLTLAVSKGAPRAGDIALILDNTIKAGESILVTRPPDLVRTTDGAHTIRRAGR